MKVWELLSFSPTTSRALSKVVVLESLTITCLPKGTASILAATITFNTTKKFNNTTAGHEGEHKSTGPLC